MSSDANRRAPAAPAPADEGEEHVILVDEHDVPTGTLGKLEAHLTGVRHRAVSVVLFRGDGAVLLQRRALGKYHSPGLWSNTCCGHPRPGEASEAAARRRLADELGMDCELEFVGAFTYQTDVGAGLIEHEIDHIFVGRSEATPVANAAEVVDWRWTAPDELAADMAAHPARYTAWCALVMRAATASNGGR